MIGGIMRFVQLFVAILILALTVPVNATDKKKANAPKNYYSSIAFDESVEKLPVGFTGNSINEVIVALEKDRRKLKKSEFETKEQYSVKLGKLSKAPLSGKLSYDNLLAFGIKSGNITKTYDAETGVMSLQLISGAVFNNEIEKALEIVTPEGLVNPMGLEITQTKLKEKRHIGQNAYGAKVLVTSGYYNAITVAAKSDNKIIKGISEIGPLMLKLPVEVAKEAKDHGGALLIGNLVPPYIGHGVDGSSATIDDPTAAHFNTTYVAMKLKSIWIYNIKTGKVLAKIPIDDYDALGKQ